MGPTTMRAAITLCLWTCAATPAGAAPFSGKVTAVTAADQLTVKRGKDRVKVRLFGVTTPTAGAHARAARGLVKKLVLGKQVGVSPRGQQRPGVVTAVVTVERQEGVDLMDDGTHRPVIITRFLGEELINAGLARWDRAGAPGAKRLKALEAMARKAGRGLWAKKKLKPGRVPSYLACKRNADCVVHYDPCGYRTPPCEDRKKPVVNVAADKRKRRTWSIKKPACRGGSLCRAGQKPGRWLRTKALCVKGKCTAR